MRSLAAPQLPSLARHNGSRSTGDPRVPKLTTFSVLADQDVGRTVPNVRAEIHLDKLLFTTVQRKGRRRSSVVLLKLSGVACLSRVGKCMWT
jgi:hypothetical protein